MWKDSETIDDYLDFDYLKKSLISIVNDKNLSPSSIGVYGDWGSGKSSLMKMAQEDLGKDKDVLCISFNGWLFEGYEDAKSALLGTILDSIKENRTLKGKCLGKLKKLYDSADKLKIASKGIKYGIDFFATGGLGTLADITIKSLTNTVLEKAKSISDEDIKGMLSQKTDSADLRQSIKTFHKDFAELLNEAKVSKLVVFIDELDRCSHDTILNTLEAIRLFLFAPNTSFVIGADERHVRNAVKFKFPEIEGNQVDIGKEYLEKLIQYPIRIPQMSPREIEYYIICLLLQKELANEKFIDLLRYIKEQKEINFIDFELTFETIQKFDQNIADKCKEILSIAKQLSSVLANGLNGNPRHCKRFLNSLAMRERMADSRNVKLDRKLLAKIMLLEYFQIELLKKIGENLSESGKPNGLANAEDDNWENNELTIWKDDVWTQKWIKTEPKLGNTDLRPYYYFLRESLSSQYNLNNLKLSPAAEKILNYLLSCSDTLRGNAIEICDQANESEANTILQKLFEALTSASDIKNEILKSFLDWGASRNSLHLKTINYLNQISGKKLSLGHISWLAGFAQKIQKVSEFNNITNKWKTENTKLVKAIDNAFVMGDK